MESRLRENPTHIIECWCEVVAPQGRDHPPWIIQKFPRTYEDDALKNVPQFTFPCAFKKVTVEHFSFVLTDADSKFLYGFCRHAPESSSAFVVLSRLPWHKLFYKLLNHCASLVNNNNPGDLWTFLQNLYQLPVPNAGGKLSVNYGGDKFFVDECPNHLALPTIPENRNLNEYFNAIDAENMMIIFASMLNERRIIITSERLSRLSACVQAANYLIYPMTWQHIFIPVLPEDLLDYLNAPMPFLIGVSSSLMQKVKIDEIGDVVILNADDNNMKTPFSDYEELPDEVISTLRKNLKPPNVLLGDNVARTFLKAIVQLVGNYREALTFREEDKRIGFDEDKFITNRPHHFQPFVEKMLQLQLFKQFIEERLELLNSGLHTSDEFELEASVFSERSSSKVKLMYSNVKKEGGAMMSDFKKKVKKHSKAVEKKSKSAYKDIRGKFKEIQQPPIKHRANPPKHLNGSTSRPQSAPSSPTLSFKKKSRNCSSYATKVSYVRPHIPSDKSTETFQGSTSDGTTKTPSPQDLDLIGELTAAFDSQFTGREFPPKCQSSSSLGYQPMTNSSSSTSLGSNPSSSSLAYEYLPEGTGGNPHSWSDPRSHSDSTNGQNIETELTKQLSASLSSLPTLDLALDIELPPPIFSISAKDHCSIPPSTSYLPVDMNPRKDYNPSVSYRSPMPVGFHTSAPKDGYSLVACERSHLINSRRDCNDMNLDSTITVKRENLVCDGMCGSQSKRTNDQISKQLSPAESYVHALKLKSNPHHLHQTNSRLPKFPKYDVSPMFSASLARFYAQNSNANYFYSSFLRSHTCVHSAKTINPCVSVVSEDIPPLSPCGVGFAGDVLFAKAPINDVMSMSLPAGLTSLSSISSNLMSNASTNDLPSLQSPPRSRRRRANTSYTTEVPINDLIFLETPQDESFDPLNSKDLVPPVPARSITATNTNNEHSYSYSQTNTSSSTSDRTNRIGPLSPSRFKPFNNIHSSNSTFYSAQNPPHVKPRLTIPKDRNSSVADNSMKYTTSLPITSTKVPLTSSNSTFYSSSNGEKPPCINRTDLLGDFSADFEKLSVKKS